MKAPTTEQQVTEYLTARCCLCSCACVTGPELRADYEAWVAAGNSTFLVPKKLFTITVTRLVARKGVARCKSGSVIFLGLMLDNDRDKDGQED